MVSQLEVPVRQQQRWQHAGQQDVLGSPLQSWLALRLRQQRWQHCDGPVHAGWPGAHVHQQGATPFLNWQEKSVKWELNAVHTVLSAYCYDAGTVMSYYRVEYMVFRGNGDRDGKTKG